jgi:hypothetical protein
MKKTDFILIAAVLLLAGAIALSLHLFGERGNLVRVEVDGNTYTVLALTQDTSLEIKTEQGSNLLVIKDGEAYVAEADCPDKICAKHKPISKRGETIICVPHRVVITVTGDSDVDAAA